MKERLEKLIDPMPTTCGWKHSMPVVSGSSGGI